MLNLAAFYHYFKKYKENIFKNKKRQGTKPGIT